ncbi:MAG: nucleoside hydrolase [Planctomycetota bacterium]
MAKIIIDTDIGDDIDDALAIAFALMRPELEVEAVTTVYGPTDLRLEIVSKLLHVLGRDDIPIAAGVGRSLGEVEANVQKRFEGHVPNQHAFIKPGDRLRPATKDDAVDLIIETVDKFAGDIILATIGAETNIALALRRDPDLAKKVKAIAIMGGAPFDNRIEWNIRCDPDAAAVVFGSPARKFVASWETSRRIVMTPPYVDKLRAVNTPIARALVEMIDLWMPKRGPKIGPVLYDICPILWAYDPGYFTIEPRRILVETKGELTRGYTVPLQGEPNCELCTDLKHQAILDLFMETVSAGMS